MARWRCAQGQERVTAKASAAGSTRADQGRGRGLAYHQRCQPSRTASSAASAERSGLSARAGRARGPICGQRNDRRNALSKSARPRLRSFTWSRPSDSHDTQGAGHIAGLPSPGSDTAPHDDGGGPREGLPFCGRTCQKLGDAYPEARFRTSARQDHSAAVQFSGGQATCDMNAEPHTLACLPKGMRNAAYGRECQSQMSEQVL
jgi:hypothetical protein